MADSETMNLKRTQIILKSAWQAPFLVLFLIFISCNEKYDFNVDNDKEGIVIEASISDKSYMESLQFPSEGRYFKVSLAKTTKVDNVRDEKISGASVKLLDDQNHVYIYREDSSNPGMYYLKDDFFKALSGVSYRLEVQLDARRKFSSAWEKMPEADNEMGKVGFDEIDKDVYQWENDKRVIKNIKAVRVRADVKSSNEIQYLKWSFDPLWVYVASLAAQDSPRKYCWITTPYYLRDFVLNKSNGRQAFPQHLFDLQTRGNERVYHYFSALIHQESVTEGYYQFWLDFQEQKNKGGLFDKPPYGLPTNYFAERTNWTVNGYFGVVSESVSRWEFTKDQLSYPVENNLQEICAQISDGTDQCANCLQYNLGLPTNRPPSWWTRRTIEPFD